VPPQVAAAVGNPVLSAVAATKSVQLAGIHLALGVNVVVTLASVVLAWLRLRPVIIASEDDLTPVAGVALWGPLLDRLNLVAEADRWVLRPIGPGGYSGGDVTGRLSRCSWPAAIFCLTGR
jgi:hypothetical protein